VIRDCHIKPLVPMFSDSWGAPVEHRMSTSGLFGHRATDFWPREGKDDSVVTADSLGGGAVVKAGSTHLDFESCSFHVGTVHDRGGRHASHDPRDDRRLSCLAAIQTASSAPALATEVSGTVSAVDFGTTTCVPRGPSNLSCTQTGFVTAFLGSLQGASVADSVAQLDCAKLRYHGHGTETFTGSIAGIGSGTLTWQLHFTGILGPDCSLLTFEGRGVVVSGTGGLASLRGNFDFTIDAYSGTLH
jgi:hypothetical protein